MQSPAEGLGTQLAGGEGSLLVGDLGLVVIKALLENGVGYIVTGWTEPANAVDAAIEDCRRGVLERRGVLLRRLRRFDLVATTVQAPGRSATMHEGPMRGVVVWNGRGGMRPALERFCQVEVPGPVVGICFDEDAARSAGLPLIDPEPTPQGVMAAFDRAFGLSAATGRPALVLLRERVLGMRGVLRCRDNILPAQAHALDAAIDAETPELAVDRLGISEAGEPAAAGPLVLVAVTPLRRATELAMQRVALLLRAADCVDAGLLLAGARVVEVGCPGLPGIATSAAVDHAGSAIVVEDQSGRLAALLADAAAGAVVARAGVRINSAGVDDIARVLIEALGEVLGDGLPAAARNAVAAELAATRTQTDELVGGRLPRRGASLHRPLPPPVTAGLVVAQAAIGVPSRMSDDFPSYRAENGAALTIVTTAEFAAAGVACAAPDARTGVFVVAGGVSADTQAAAGVAGATVELVDGSRPRQLAEAIARACAGARPVPHVIFLAQPPTVVGHDRAAGIDAELLGSERLSTAGLDPSTLLVAEQLDDELLAGPAVSVADPRGARAGLEGAAELSPAWYDVQAGAMRTGMAAAARTIRRRVVRGIGGMEP